jgi:hypothetical protein
MAIKDYILKDCAWDQADTISGLSSDVRSGYCRALALHLLCDCAANPKITIAKNFSMLIGTHSGNLNAIAKTQADTSKIGALNALEMTTLHLLQISSTMTIGALGAVWPGAAGPGQTLQTAVALSTRTPKLCFVHLEWDAAFHKLKRGGAHAIAVVREDGVGENTYNVFEPNYGILRAYTSSINALMDNIVSAYGVDRFMAMPLN